MFNIGDGKRKFYFNYKAIESIISEPKKFWHANNIILLNNQFKDNSENEINLIFKRKNNDKEKSSHFFITKNKHLSKLKKDIQAKKLDLLMNKALERSNPIRAYSSNNYKIIKKKYLNKTNFNFPKIKLKEKNIVAPIPAFSQNIIKKNIIDTAYSFFPERYINSRENHRDDNEKLYLNNSIKNKKKLEDEYKKLYSLKFIHPGPISKNNKEKEIKRKTYKLVGSSIQIYNKNNKNKFFNNSDKETINKKIDVGLNTISHLY